VKGPRILGYSTTQRTATRRNKFYYIGPFLPYDNGAGKRFSRYKSTNHRWQPSEPSLHFHFAIKISFFSIKMLQAKFLQLLQICKSANVNRASKPQDVRAKRPTHGFAVKFR
jgi:hypothetical protein